MNQLSSITKSKIINVNRITNHGKPGQEEVPVLVINQQTQGQHAPVEAEQQNSQRKRLQFQPKIRREQKKFDFFSTLRQYSTSGFDKSTQMIEIMRLEISKLEEKDIQADIQHAIKRRNEAADEKRVNKTVIIQKIENQLRQKDPSFSFQSSLKKHTESPQQFKSYANYIEDQQRQIRMQVFQKNQLEKQIDMIKMSLRPTSAFYLQKRSSNGYQMNQYKQIFEPPKMTQRIVEACQKHVMRTNENRERQRSQHGSFDSSYYVFNSKNNESFDYTNLANSGLWRTPHQQMQFEGMTEGIPRVSKSFSVSKNSPFTAFKKNQMSRRVSQEIGVQEYDKSKLYSQGGPRYLQNNYLKSSDSIHYSPGRANQQPNSTNGKDDSADVFNNNRDSLNKNNNNNYINLNNNERQDSVRGRVSINDNRSAENESFTRDDLAEIEAQRVQLVQQELEELNKKLKVQNLAQGEFVNPYDPKDPENQSPVKFLLNQYQNVVQENYVTFSKDMQFIIDSYQLNPPGQSWDLPTITTRTVDINLSQSSKTQHFNNMLDDNEDLFNMGSKRRTSISKESKNLRKKDIQNMINQQIQQLDELKPQIQPLKQTFQKLDKQMTTDYRNFKKPNNVKNLNRNGQYDVNDFFRQIERNQQIQQEQVERQYSKVLQEQMKQKN